MGVQQAPGSRDRDRSRPRVISLEDDHQGDELPRRVVHRTLGHDFPVARRVENVRR